MACLRRCFCVCVLVLLAAGSAFPAGGLAHTQVPNFDFETGDLSGWTATGTAFQSQPTWGDNPSARGRETSGHEGQFWIGTFENRPANMRAAGNVQGDAPQGTLSSTVFTISGGTVSFLVGGGATFETRVVLYTIDPIEGAIRQEYASGQQSETMRRVTWNLEPLRGQQGQIRIIDESSEPWGHINADDFRFATTVLAPPAIARPRAPVGIASPPRQLDLPSLTATVPGVVGQNIDAALEILKRSGFEGRTAAQAESDASVGTVLSQKPEAGSNVARGIAVDLVVAIAPTPQPDPRLIVPAVVGRDYRSALEILKRVGIEGRVAAEAESSRSIGTVLAQQPEAGSAIARGTPVDLTVAVPPAAQPDPPLIVPDVVGRNLRTALVVLRNSGFEANVSEQEDPNNAPGTVTAQVPTPRSAVARGTPVALTVATAPPPPQPDPMLVVPDVLGQDVRTALEILKNSGFDGNVGTREDARNAPGTVVAQVPAPRTEVERGTPVEITAAIAPEPPPVVTTIVPNVVGSPEPSALAVLGGADLVVAEVSYQPSAATTGTVLAQSLNPGTTVEVATPVTLVVAAEIPAEPETETTTPPATTPETEPTAPPETEPEAPPEIETTPPPETTPETAPSTPLETGSTPGSPAAPALVAIPPLVGLSQEDAVTVLLASGLVAGLVTETVSLESGGTVLAQGPAPGTQVVVGSVVALQVAGNRAAWVIPAAVLLLFAVGATVAVRRRTKGKPPEKPDAEPPSMQPEFRAVQDPGNQHIESGGEKAARDEIRLRPRTDAGTQTIETPGGVIADERRTDE